ncbi:hypothetical protein [Kitasatospora sp. KL5]|uniref:hypothetical protein n=1 Tax=Kitasatospora sp. KL5 TaxID=3425125 RepID=UPI003D6EC7A6
MTLITTPFDMRATAAEVLSGVGLTGRHAKETRKWAEASAATGFPAGQRAWPVAHAPDAHPPDTSRRRTFHEPQDLADHRRLQRAGQGARRVRAGSRDRAVVVASSTAATTEPASRCLEKEADRRGPFEVNFFGTAALTREVLPGMHRRRTDVIVNAPSMDGSRRRCSPVTRRGPPKPSTPP